MSLLALLFALLGERGLTHLLRLREPRWLDRYGDFASARLRALPRIACFVVAALVVALPVVPVAIVSGLLGSQLLGLPQLGFAVLVLLLSFGPRDLKDEVDDYVAALERGDREEAARRGKELLESDAVGRETGLRDAVEEAIFVQANNRVFGVIFWFMVLGPTGASLFRVSDLLRRRAAFEAVRAGGGAGSAAADGGLALVHGVLAWLPARLVAVTYALSGSFEDAVGNWRAAAGRAGESLLDRNENLLARVGRASLQPTLAGTPADGLDLATARGAWRIVARSLWIWLAAIAALVLAGHAT